MRFYTRAVIARIHRRHDAQEDARRATVAREAAEAARQMEASALEDAKPISPELARDVATLRAMMAEWTAAHPSA